MIYIHAVKDSLESTFITVNIYYVPEDEFSITLASCNWPWIFCEFGR